MSIRHHRKVPAIAGTILCLVAILAPRATGATEAAGAGGTGQLVVKIVAGADIGPVNAQLGSTTRSVLLASHGVYLLDVPLRTTSTDPAKRSKEWQKQAKEAAAVLDKRSDVVYADPNTDADITQGDRFHYWPSGGPNCIAADSSAFTAQPVATALDLTQVHRTARGTGQVIAVLDTGLATTHPALAGRLAPGGYDYVDDDALPDEVIGSADRDGDLLTNEGYGHGTFVAGLAALVAPDAKIMPMRVLDAEGRGNVFMVAEAVYDATTRGADVINMSFGTAERTNSRVLSDAVANAVKAGVVVVAAAGNDGSAVQHYPAAMKDVVSVAALATNGTGLAAFSSHGAWVDLAAPGEHVISSLPCGYGTWSGTSMAAPFVAGAAALLGVDAKAKNVPNARILKALDEGCDRIKGMSVRTGAIDLVRSLARI
jgi:subtilisin family serine protease